jgi:3-methyladenine DNA glycosylase AlkD
MGKVSKGMSKDKLVVKLRRLAKGNDEYREFNARIVNDLADGMEFIGVRVPDLRKIAKEIAGNNWRTFLRDNNWQIYEMKQIAFLLPSYLELDFDEFFALYDQLIPHASSWANCDTLGLKRSFITENPAKSWARIGKYLDSPDAWAVRIGLNLVFANFLDDANIERVLAEIIKIDARYREKAPRGTLNYYVKMMLAWTLAEAATKFRDRVETILPKLDPETAKYTRQKMRDSYRII